MNFTQDVFSIIRKIFVVSDELTRVSNELKELTRTSTDHEVRIAVIENTLTLTRRSSKLILPGN